MPSGILLLDKPCGLSSNGALQRVRALLGKPKAGHVGSLDPLASGMLPICLAEATKVAGEILAARKRYRFTVALGTRTVTGDAEGEVCERAPVAAIGRDALERTLRSLLGVQQQVPPMYSALKHAGQPLYRLARAGVTVERAPRRIELSELTLIAAEAASLTIEALCSSGTYIRVLAQDIAVRLGTVGHVSALRRLYVEPFEGEAMQTLEMLGALRARGDWPVLLPADWPLGHLPAVQLSASQTQRLLHGERVSSAHGPGAGRVRLYDESGRFLGIGEADAAGAVQPRRLLNLAP